MLKLIGLSNSTVQVVIQRREQGLPTLTSAQIGRLKNVGESEKKILDLIYQDCRISKPKRTSRGWSPPAITPTRNSSATAAAAPANPPVRSLRLVFCFPHFRRDS